MDIQKEREAYLKMLVGNDAISNDQAETLKLMPEGSHFYTYGNQVSVAKLDLINWGWNSWVKAKSQAVPEGFVSIKDGLPRDGQYVIAFDAIKHCVFKDGEFLQGYFESDTGHEYSEPVEVTHWMAIEAQEQSHDSQNP